MGKLGAFLSHAIDKASEITSQAISARTDRVGIRADVRMHRQDKNQAEREAKEQTKQTAYMNHMDPHNSALWDAVKSSVPAVAGAVVQGISASQGGGAMSALGGLFGGGSQVGDPNAVGLSGNVTVASAGNKNMNMYLIAGAVLVAFFMFKKK